MIPGTERARAALLGLTCAALLTGCPGRRPAPPPRPATTAVATPTATARPQASATATPVTPSLAPPAPIDSLPAHASAALATAARMAERARVDLAAGRADEGLQLLEQAMQVESGAPFAYYYMAAVYLERGRADEAEVLAQRAATLAHGYPAGWAGHAHVLRGQALEDLGRADEAAHAYRAALAADPGNTPAREALRRLTGDR